MLALLRDKEIKKMNNKEIFMDKVASCVKNSVDINNINAVRQSIFHNWAKEESERHCFLMLGVEDYEYIVHRVMG